MYLSFNLYHGSEGFGMPPYDPFLVAFVMRL